MEENRKEETGQMGNKLAEMPVGKLLRSLAMPAIAAQIVNLLYNMVDRIYIGHIEGVGALALTGLGVTLPVITLVAAFASLIGAGGAPRASIAMGRGEYGEAERILVVEGMGVGPIYQESKLFLVADRVVNYHQSVITPTRAFANMDITQ